MEFFDCHCHTELSACAEDVSLQMYTEIAEKNDCAFCITDHSAHLFYPPGQAWAFWGDDAESIFDESYADGLIRCAEYVEWVRKAQTGNMLVGVELDVMPDGRLVFDPALLPELDFILGAVHGVRGLEDRPLDEVIDGYKSRTLRLFEAGARALAHPFREWKQKERTVPESLLEWLVETAKDAGVALELNCHFHVPEYDVPMLRLCAEAGVPIAIGTDTHRSYEFGDFTYHIEMLRQAGIAEDTWPTILMPAPVVVRSD